MGRPILLTKQSGPEWVDCVLDSAEVVIAWDAEIGPGDHRTRLVLRNGMQIDVRETASDIHELLTPLKPKEGLK